MLGSVVVGLLLLLLQHTSGEINNNKRLEPLLTPWTDDVTPENAWTEYPRPGFAREEWKCLNGLWNYSITDMEVTMPGETEGNILVPFCIESYLSGVQKQVMAMDNLLWYSRTFSVPDAWTGRTIQIVFEAVDYESTVFVNKHLVGTHSGGYDRFSYDITDYLNGGDELIEVKVWDPSDLQPIPQGKQVNTEHYPGEIFYTPVSGIWQSVWLEPVPQNHLENLQIFPDISTGVVTILINSRTDSQLRVEVSVSDGEETVTAGEATGGGEVMVSLPVPNLRLWSPQDPFLYNLTVTLVGEAGGEAIDHVTSYFGMRSISLETVDGFKRFFLNGEELFFQFGPLDQGFWPDGIYTPPTLEALKWDLTTTKNLGYNMIRKHIKVEPELWYYWADRLGLLVWQDFPSVINSKIYFEQEAKDQFMVEIREWVEQLYNHPSIVLWVVFNEAWGQHDTVNVTAFARSLDSSRIITDASGWNDAGVGDVLDFHCYPGPNCTFPTVPDPNRALVLGEFWGRRRLIPGHNWFGDDGVEEGLSQSEFLSTYESTIDDLLELRKIGYSAAVITQTTDVEGELNGMYTYDRVRSKADMRIVTEQNHRLTQAATTVH